MLNVRPLLRYWAPVVIWMVVIFSASSDQMSFQRSSRIIAPLVLWLFPHLPEAKVEEIVFCVRKCAHLTEFAILAGLIWRALRQPAQTEPRPWDWRQATAALLLVLLYASSDEFHQLFVSSRQASVIDVLIDTAGGAGGLLVIWAVGRWRKRW